MPAHGGRPAGAPRRAAGPRDYPWTEAADPDRPADGGVGAGAPRARGGATRRKGAAWDSCARGGHTRPVDAAAARASVRSERRGMGVQRGAPGRPRLAPGDAVRFTVNAACLSMAGVCGGGPPPRRRRVGCPRPPSENPPRYVPRRGRGRPDSQRESLPTGDTPFRPWVGDRCPSAAPLSCRPRRTSPSAPWDPMTGSRLTRRAVGSV